MKTRDRIREEALSKLEEHNYIGTLVLNTGAGKSRIAIEAIKQGDYNNILIVSPRTNLKENWKKELEKWNLELQKVTIENIQTAYKWDETKIQNFDIIIFDEIHTTTTEKYGLLLEKASKLNISRIGLTATPDIVRRDDKKDFYDLHCPIIYQYLTSEEDKVTNKKLVYVVYYDLDNNHMYQVETKTKTWKQGEKAYYDYLEKTIKESSSQITRLYPMYDVLGVKAVYALRNPGIPRPLKSLLRKYWWAISNRKKLLWTLSSSVHIALRLKKRILASNSENKILLFTELTEKCERLSKYTIHSKKDKLHNDIMIETFNTKQIRELASCQSLTLGMNLVGANYAVFESFNSSETNNLQKQGRLNRLPVEDEAILIYIVPRDTQAQVWFEKATENQEIKTININQI